MTSGTEEAASHPPAGREAELRQNLTALRSRIAAACAAAGRPEQDVTLIAVTKTFPASDVRLLVAMGVTEIGENRDQEAAPKAAACSDLRPPLRWHFVGQLQVNKCASVVHYADVVHSVDRPRLIRALGSRARSAGRTLTCLVQVNLDPAAAAGPGGIAAGAVHDQVPDGAAHADVHRGGALPGQVLELADAVAAQEGLELGGVMAVAPLGQPARPAFRRLAEVAALVRSAHPDATMISAGMTGDLEEAVAEGATHVRVGTALLGSRRAFVR